MRSLVVGTFLSLDGVMQAPGGPDEDRSGGFEHGGWVAPYFDDAMGQRMVEWTHAADAVLLGRRTYEIFAAHWRYIGDEDPIAAKLNRVPKYVASRTLQQVNWANSTLLRGDLADAVAQLKREGTGEIQVTGSADLIQTLLAHGLVDAFRLWTFPIVLGKGKRLFGGGATPAGLALRETTATSTGAILQVYDVVGRPSYGSFALEQPSEEELVRRQRIAWEG
ncbi:MAG TPA: dihydrofolate reductase family protein [Gemmatimonadaceae bacterium]|nr:dihydrofolate reductase family protein [Gemmatimonadaceae bacterium]